MARERPTRPPARPRRPGRARPSAAAPGLGAGFEARARACGLLAERARVFPEASDATLDETGLDARDAALAHAIADHATRSWLTLRHLLAGFLRSAFEDLEPPMRAALLAGAGQIVVMDRVPVHAAIDLSVEWAKRAIRPGAAGLVNAVLRRLAELTHDPSSRKSVRRMWTGAQDEIPLADGTALALARPVLPRAGAARLAIATGHSPWLISRWLDRFGAETARVLAHHSLTSPPVILNIAHAREPLGPSPHLAPHDKAGHAVCGGPREFLSHLLASRSDIWVQDPASALAVAGAADLDPALVLDLCAGQGTKTRQLAAMFPRARIVACDPDPSRQAVLRGTFAGSGRVAVLARDEVQGTLAGRADLILLDVPCSNTGVLARRAEAKYRAGPAQLARLTALQGRIIDEAAGLLAPTGRIVYSTCSLEDEENHAVAAGAARHGLGIEHELFTLPSGVPGGPPAGYHDGSYSARLTRAPIN